MSRKDLKQYTNCKSHKEKDGKRLITNFTLSKLQICLTKETINKIKLPAIDWVRAL